MFRQQCSKHDQRGGVMIRVFLIVFVVLLSACDNGGANQGDLTVSMTMDSLPQTVTYNKASTPDGYVEYEWGVAFDINGDGAINQGDVALKILQFKTPGNVERTGTIADFDAFLWTYTDNIASETVAKATFQVSGNTITITIPRSADSSLKSINDSTLVNFSTTTYDMTAGYEKSDYYPSMGAVVNIPTNGEFTDAQGDADFNYIDMVSMSITL